MRAHRHRSPVASWAQFPAASSVNRLPDTRSMLRIQYGVYINRGCQASRICSIPPASWAHREDPAKPATASLPSSGRASTSVIFNVFTPSVVRSGFGQSVGQSPPMPIAAVGRWEIDLLPTPAFIDAWATGIRTWTYPDFRATRQRAGCRPNLVLEPACVTCRDPCPRRDGDEPPEQSPTSGDTGQQRRRLLEPGAGPCRPARPACS